MARNMVETAKQVEGSLPEQYDLTVADLQDLYRILNDSSTDGKFNALCMAFQYGFALGAEAQKKGDFCA